MQWKNPDGSQTGGVVIEDGAGNKLGTVANPLNVTGGGGGGGGGSNASVGVTGSSMPSAATAVGFQNGSGNLAVPSPSAGLPIADSGASITGASMPAGGLGLSGWLSAIWSKLSGTLSVSWAGQSVNIGNFPSTQAVSVASLPLPANAAADGADATGITQLTGGTGIRGWLSGIYSKVSGTLTAALAASTNVIGYAGSLNFGPVPFTCTLASGSYAVGACLGGLKTLSIFRNTTQPSATLAQFKATWLGGQTTGIVVYAFAKNPTASTFTDGTVVVLNAADEPYLIAPPFVLSPSTIAGLTTTFASLAGSWPAKNADTSVSTNIYIAFAAVTAIAAPPTAVYGSISGVQD